MGISFFIKTDNSATNVSIYSK